MALPRLFLGFFLLTLARVLSGAPQAPAVRDTDDVLRRLRQARGADSIVQLLAMADLRSDQPSEMLAAADVALQLLSRFPSAALEARGRIARSHALQALGEYPRALVEARIADSLAVGTRDPSLAGAASYQVGFVLWRMADYAQALRRAEQARTQLLPFGQSATLVRTLSLVGAIHHSRSELEAGLTGYLAALQMAEAMGDEIAAARAHNNIGLVYLDLGRNAEAHAALKRALEIHERRGPRANLTNTLNNIGLALIELGRPREALPHFERALEYDREAANPYGEAKLYSNIGYVHEKLGDQPKALEFHRRALAIRTRIGDKDGMVRTYGALAEVQMRLGDVRGAIPQFERGIALAAQISDRRDESDQLELLARARATVGDTAGAYLAYQRFHALSAALSDSATRGRIAELEAKYEARERERELAALATLAESRRTRLRWAVTGAVLLSLLIVLLGVLYVLRTRAQRALQESETRYRALFQSSAVPTFLVDGDGTRVLELNPPARHLTGAGNVDAMRVEEVRPEWLRVALARASGAGAHDQVALDDAWTDDAGQTRWTEVRGSPVALGGRACRLITVRDTTEAHREEERRQREDKMEALGVLAGGIAHDFNNALTAIVGHVTLARDGDDADRASYLEVAEQAAIGARRLTTQLLAFAKGGQPIRRVSNIAQLVRDAVALSTAGATVRVVLDLPPDLWSASVDPGQFTQAIGNLVINAQQAMGEGGTLTVRGTNVAAEVPWGGDGAGRLVRIDVGDTGPGIPERIRSRVFDPYFTTKPGGSGLGLATAFAICRHHGGTLSFETVEGRGTTFSACFPAASPSLEVPESTPTSLPRGEGSILVLDDEPMVRHVLRRMLERWGYDVEAVADGRQAVDRYVDRLGRGTPFDLLIMDLTIPGGMGGRQAMSEVLRHDPHARAIVASGYSDDPTMANYREAGFVASLAKPFRAAELATVVAAILGGSRSGVA